MAHRLYHPGRRKRRHIMHERAFAIVFGIDPEKRQIRFPAELRDLLEALVDADAAFEGNANMDRCLVAGEKALGKSTTHVSGKISELKLMGFVRFEAFSGGARLIIDDSTLQALIKLEEYALMIDTTTRIEDRGGLMPEGSEIIVQKLKNDNIYIGVSDSELDELMRDVIQPIVDERRADRTAKKGEKMKKLAEIKPNGLKQVCGIVAAALITNLMFVENAKASTADRGGTVGLVFSNAYKH